MKLKAFSLHVGCGVGTIRSLERLGVVSPIKDNKGHRVYSNIDALSVCRFLDKQKRGVL